MSLSLEEALSQVELEVGKTYYCRVNGRPVVVTVTEEPLLDAPEIDESAMMLSAWTELPLSEPTIRGIAPLTESPLPDVPEIPQDEEEAP